MSLAKNTLRDELRKFCDPGFGSFGGYPTSKDEACDKWASAFQTYINDMVIVSPDSVTVKDTAATFSGVHDAFKGVLTFANGIIGGTEATELSNAWKAGMGAITLVQVPGAGYASATQLINSVGPFADLDSPRSDLENALKPLFTGPSADGNQRCDDIATAIHTATLAGGKSCPVVYANPPPPGNTGSGTVDFG